MGTQPLPWSAELVTVGGIYHHKSDHTRGYQVLHITNTGQFSDKFPPQVVYQHPATGTIWSRPLAGFLNEFELKEETWMKNIQIIMAWLVAISRASIQNWRYK